MLELFEDFREGDVIFQTTNSRQAEAIRLTTKSLYTHIGIVYESEEGLYVYESNRSVRTRSLRAVIESGIDQKYVVKRLIECDRLLTDKAIANMKKVGDQYLGRLYDSFFEWSDERFYCSELVWKIFDEGLGIKLCELKELRDYDLDQTLINRLKDKFNENIPWQEEVVTPIDIFNSKYLVEVFSNE